MRNEGDRSTLVHLIRPPEAAPAPCFFANSDSSFRHAVQMTNVFLAFRGTSHAECRPNNLRDDWTKIRGRHGEG